MPGFDGTGPYGGGPMTGGGRGLCNPANAYGTSFPTGYGRGFVGGRRFMRYGQGVRRAFGGRGFGWNQPVFGGYYTTDTAGELDILKKEADYAKNSLEAINKRISELEKKSE